MVLSSNAVVYPWAMVIKALNAAVTDIAVATPLGSDDLAVGT
jgi:hypothetical protein